jgi:hypothetical protein
MHNKRGYFDAKMKLKMNTSSKFDDKMELKMNMSLTKLLFIKQVRYYLNAYKLYC